MESWPIVEPTNDQAVEVLAEHREEPFEVDLRAAGVAVKLDLGRLGLDERPDFQGR
jgi:hypothetical protein